MLDASGAARVSFFVEAMRQVTKALILGIVASVTLLASRVCVGLDGDSGLFVILGCLPTSLLLRHVPPQYHFPALLLGQVLVWGGIWLLVFRWQTLLRLRKH
jgi:hypothetical protein